MDRRGSENDLYRDYWGQKIAGACLIDHRNKLGSCDLFQPFDCELGNPVCYKFRPVSFCAFKEEGCLSIKTGIHKLIFTSK